MTKAYYAGINPYGNRAKSDGDHVNAFASKKERDAFVSVDEDRREALTRDEAVKQFGESMVNRARELMEIGAEQSLDAITDWI